MYREEKHYGYKIIEHRREPGKGDVLGGGLAVIYHPGLVAEKLEKYTDIYRQTVLINIEG